MKLHVTLEPGGQVGRVAIYEYWGQSFRPRCHCIPVVVNRSTALKVTRYEIGRFDIALQ
jgi:hypothetical protein